MGRAIKFRAYNRQEQKMYEVTALQWDAADPCKFSKLELLSLDGLHTVRRVIGEVCDTYDLLEYTGLKDRNGQEIFEGDVVRINHPHDLTGDFTNAIGQVFWWDEEGGWYHGNGNGRPPKRMWKYVEVIGNVYEHPELLKEE